MGIWALSPVDLETWHGEECARYFMKVFGLPKGLLMISDLRKGLQNPYQHAYTPRSYFPKIYKYIDELKKTDYKALEKKLKKFYLSRKKAKDALAELTPKNLSSLSNDKLLKVYTQNRDWVHQITVYDQFGWLAEEYWTPLLPKILSEKIGLTIGSEEYHRVLFALTKPEEISTTLEERRGVLAEVIQIQTLKKASKKLAVAFGWMPVFTYGVPWGAAYYEQTLKEMLQKDERTLQSEYTVLKNYSAVRNREINDIVKKYKINPEDLQVFVDFGLALDTRNEAEYVVSFAGFYLLPVYAEIAKRLGLSIFELRTLYEKEIAGAVQGKYDYKGIIENRKKGYWVGFGFDEAMGERIDFGPEEAEKLFHSIEAGMQSIQGNNEFKGTCASTGKAKGVARIIPSPDQNSRVNDGDILITYATTVDYLPAMKKAAAIVTEVGGLTCHAAVVSREFGIPCVVALKNAMMNFKDGEMIEVDADRGVVRIINKKV